MTWTAAAVIPLGLLQSYYGTRAASLAYAVLDLFAMTLPVFIPALLWTVVSRRQKKWLVRLLIVSLVGSFLAGIGWYLLEGRRSPFYGVMTGVAWSAFYASMTFVWVGNVLAMERMGLRSWPARASA